MNMITRQEYPALNDLLWDTKAKFIEPKQAFHMYEKRWRYVDKNKLTAHEQQLIEQLIQEIGHGLFMPA